MPVLPSIQRFFRPIAALVFFALMKPSALRAQLPSETIGVTPVEIDSLLVNPGIGFNTFQHFNGDSLFPGMGWKEGFPLLYQSYKDGLNRHYPQTSIAYWRVYWRYIQPEKNVYRWDMIDRALDSAHRRGQKLMLRIAPYGSASKERDVPDWYRQMVGPGTDFVYNNPVNKWVVDGNDPRYAQYFGGFIRELGKRYDGHPDLESVDLSIVGAWGEGAGSELLTNEAMHALIDAYTESFRHTPLLVMLMDEKTNKYASSSPVPNGWRADCLGDLGFWAKDQNGWTHMYDYYPESIIEYGLQDAWKKAPVSFEICGTFLSWRDEQHYNKEQVKYIFDEALKWHISSFNAKSSPVPAEWEPLVNDWLKKMGYRFVLKRFKYPREVKRNQKLAFESWWENKGVAPCYSKYPLAIRLRSSLYQKVFITGADIRDWLPGDNLWNEALYLPSDIPVGVYDIQVGILGKDSQDGKLPAPILKLAIEGRDKEGWYTLGKIRVN
jgi:hypothetical protein